MQLVGESVVQSEGGRRRLVINYKGSPYGADVALYPQTMKDVIEKLQSVEADEVVLSEYYERIYSEEQTKMLKQIADLVTRLETDAVWSPSHLGRTTESKKLAPRHDTVLGVLNNLKSDPFKAYLSLLAEIKSQASKANTLTGEDLEDLKVYLQTLVFIRDQVEKLALVMKMKAYVTQLGSLPADRGIYHSLFEVSIKPSFIGSRIFFTATENLELVDQYDVVGSKVYIYKHPDKVEYLYFLNPPEYTLAPDKYFLLEKTKEVVAGHRPGEVGFMDIGQARQYFHKIYVATISDLAARNNIQLSVEEKEELAEIVSRYTIGYGILEILLSDKQLTDVFLDAPLGVKPIYLVHGKYGQCQTNVVFSEEEARAVVSRFRALSGRPFDEAHPILDFDLEDLQTRIAVIGRPLSLDGIAFAFRLHKVTPWTLPQFLDLKMFNKFSAGLLSFFVDAQASMLIVGSRGAGKCVSGDTLIQLADGSLEKIRDLVEPRIQSAKQLTDVGDGVCAPCEDLNVFNLTPDLKIRPAPVSKVWRRTAPAHLYKIRLSSGKEIECTPEHPFFVSREGLILPLRADSLEKGEFVATPRIIPVENARTAPAPTSAPQFSTNYNYLGCLSIIQRDLRRIAEKEELKAVAEKTGLNYRSLYNLKNGVRNAVSGEELLKISSYARSDLKEYAGKISGIRTYHSTHHFKPEALTRPLDEKFARFLGLLYGDGHVDEVEVTLTNVSDALRAEFAALTEEIFGVKSIDRHPKQRSPITQISSRGLSRLLRERFGIPCGDKSSTQEMPQEIMKSENGVLAAFIRGYFDCDSSVSFKTNVIEFSTASKKMAEQMQCALLRFGIVARKKPKVVKGVTYWRLFLYGENCLAYLQKISFGLAYKQERLEKGLAGRKFNSNVDVVPGARHFLHYTKQNYGFGKLSLDQHELGREKARKLASEFFAKKPGDQKISHFQQLANSDIFWDAVESIEKTPSREPFVYDLTVDVTHSFVANGIVAHNTSLLQAMMQETPQNLRVILQEDTQEIPASALKKLGFNIQRLKTRPPLGKASESEISAEDALRIALRLGDSVLIVGEVRSSIRGNEEVLVIENGLTKRLPISELDGKNVSNYSVPTLDFDLKMNRRPLKAFVKHPRRNKLLKVTTRTGRSVTVTHDHSLFTATKDFKVAPIECKDLKPGDRIVIPASVPYGFNDLDALNALDLLPEFRVQNFENDIREAIMRLGWREATKVCGISSGDIYNYFRHGKNQQTYPPVSSFKRLMQEAEIEYSPEDLLVRRGTSSPIPAMIPVNEEFCRFLGYYVSEGYHSGSFGTGGSVIITNSNEKILADVKGLSETLFGITPSFREVHGAGDSVQARLNSSPLAALVSRLGCGRICTEKRIPPIIFGLSKPKIAAFLRALYSGDGGFTASASSGNCVRYFSTSKKLVEDVAYLLLAFGIVGTIRNRKVAKGNEGWIFEFKDRHMVEVFLKEIGFVQKQPKMLVRKWAHTAANSIHFDGEILRKHLKKFPREYRHLFRFLRCSKNYLKKVVSDPRCEASEELKVFANGEFFLDEVKQVEEIDLAEPEFVFDLSVEPSQNFVGGFGGILLHNTEAKALFEAMRVGAVGNVVMGTIHGENAYSIWDRIVNDLGVPTTSFKATDFAVVAAPIRFKGSLKRYRRLLEVTEVRKHWKNDPGEEGGFLQWLSFDANKDDLDFYENDLKASEWLQKIERNRGLKYDDIIAEITSRAETKWHLVELKRKYGLPKLLEAEYSVRAHGKYLLLGEKQREEFGSVDHGELLNDWKKWVGDTILKEASAQKQAEK